MRQNPTVYGNRRHRAEAARLPLQSYEDTAQRWPECLLDVDTHELQQRLELDGFGQGEF